MADRSPPETAEPPRLPVAEFDPSRVAPGTKARMHLVVDLLPDGQPLAMPALVARGASAGKTLLATGAVHGDEYEGPVAIQDLFEALDPRAMQGTFIGIPVVNAPAFTAATREGGYDGQNLARIFPGSVHGTLSERIANALGEYVLGSGIDLYADLHAAGRAYRITQFAGYQLLPPVADIQRAAAIAFGLPLVWGTAPLSGRSLSSAWDKRVPAIYVEMEGEGRCRAANRALAVTGLHNLLAYLGILDRAFPTEAQLLVEDDRDQSGHLQVENLAPVSGLFLGDVDVWDRVESGDRLGVVRHPDGRQLAEVTSRKAGRVLFIRTLPRVFSGESVGYVIEVD